MQAREAVVYLQKYAQHYREPDPAAIQADGISGTALPSSLVECLHARSPGSLSHVWAAGVWGRPHATSSTHGPDVRQGNVYACALVTAHVVSPLGMLLVR